MDPVTGGIIGLGEIDGPREPTAASLYFAAERMTSIAASIRWA